MNIKREAVVKYILELDENEIQSLANICSDNYTTIYDSIQETEANYDKQVRRKLRELISNIFDKYTTRVAIR